MSYEVVITKKNYCTFNFRAVVDGQVFDQTYSGYKKAIARSNFISFIDMYKGENYRLGYCGGTK
jgi:hypothetical protein